MATRRFEMAVCRLKFVEESYVLNRDDGLTSEGLDQGDLRWVDRPTCFLPAGPGGRTYFATIWLLILS